jgi:hypothetical protein
VTGEWRELHNEERHDLYFFVNYYYMIWTKHVAGMGDEKIQNLVVIVEGKIIFGRLECRWQDNIKMDVTEIIR